MTTEYLQLLHSEMDQQSTTNITEIIDCGPQLPTLKNKYFTAVVYTMYSIIFLLSSVGNGIICYVVIFFPRLHTVTNYFILNLAIGDLLITILCIPFTVFSMVLQYWPFSNVLCPIVNYAQVISVFISAYTLVAISVDRYMAIICPLRLRISNKTSALEILFIWIFAAIIGLPILMTARLEQPSEWHQECSFWVCQENWTDFGGEENRNRYSNILFVLQYIIPLFVLIFTYTSIALVMCCRSIPGEAESIRDQRIARSKRKTVQMMVIVVLVYTICWLPLNIVLIIDNSMFSGSVLSYIWFCVHWFAMSHTCYSPIIYCYMNAQFKSSVFQTLRPTRCLIRYCRNRQQSPPDDMPLATQYTYGQNRHRSSQNMRNMRQNVAEQWQ